MLSVEDVAKVCHAVNKALCESFNDRSQLPWHSAEDWQRESALEGVQWRLDNQDAPESAQHDKWMASKMEAGWAYGEKKNAILKTHDCLLPFAELPPHQKAKDALFVAVVESLRDKIGVA